MRKLVSLLAAAMAAAVGGCLELNVLWSPDGQRALLRGESGLYVTDAAGRLTQASTQPAAAMAFLPDSRRVVIQEPVNVSWEQAARLLPPEQVTQARLAGEALMAKLRATEGEGQGLLQSLQADAGADVLGPVLLYLRDRYGQELSQRLKQEWEGVRQAELPIYRLRLARLEDKGLAPIRALAHWPAPAAAMELSPDGRQLAFTAEVLSGGAKSRGLFICPVDGSDRPRQVDLHVGWQMAWSPDGRRLACFAGACPGREQKGELGELREYNLAEAASAPASATAPTSAASQTASSSPSPRVVAAVYFQPDAGLAYLADGSILFSGVAITLPASSGTSPQHRLFVTGGEETTAPTVIELTIDMSDWLKWFRLSPDRQRVLLPGTGGRLAVLTLKDRSVRVIQETPANYSSADYNFSSVPVWRGADTVCFGVPAGSPHGSPDRPELVLARLGEPIECRCISRQWADDLVVRLAGRSKPTATATAPTSR